MRRSRRSSVNAMTVLSPSDATPKDFSEHTDVRFTIDNDIFLGVPGIPALDLMKFGAMFDGISEENLKDQPDTFVQMFELVLDEPSATKFIQRMSDKLRPITMTQILKILPWLMEEYGMRPTLPPPNSSDGSESPDGGTSSTENAPAPESIPSLSQPTDS